MELQEIHKKILALCVDDYSELWIVIAYVSNDAYSWDSMPVWVRQKTIEVIEDLLHNGLIEIGEFWEKPKFEPMSVSTPEAIAYINKMWDELGRTPNLGDGCWFVATEKGKLYAKEHGISV
jgi:hypothetical protein